MNPKYASQQKKEKFQQFTELERERNIGLREGGFSYSANTSSCAAEQFHSDASMEAVDRRAPKNSKNWQWETEGVVNARQSKSAPHGSE